MHKVQQRLALTEASAIECGVNSPGKQGTTPLCTQTRHPGSGVFLWMPAVASVSQQFVPPRRPQHTYWWQYES